MDKQVSQTALQTQGSGPVDDIFVAVLLTQAPGGGTISYDHKWRIGSGPEQTGPILVPFGSRYKMIFTLQGTTTPDLTFKANPKDAMWVKNGGIGCPEEQGNGGQIDLAHGTSTPKVLTVINKNKDRGDLHFMLRFDPDPHAYDPEIRNSGGGLIRSRSVAVALIGIGAALVGLAALFALRR